MDRISGRPATTWRRRQSQLLVSSLAGAFSRSSTYADRQFLPWAVPVDVAERGRASEFGGPVRLGRRAPRRSSTSACNQSARWPSGGGATGAEAATGAGAATGAEAA